MSLVLSFGLNPGLLYWEMFDMDGCTKMSHVVNYGIVLPYFAWQPAVSRITYGVLVSSTAASRVPLVASDVAGRSGWLNRNVALLRPVQFFSGKLRKLSHACIFGRKVLLKKYKYSVL